MASPEIADSRAEQRYRCALAVTLRRRGTDEQLLTSEVSFRGAYVRTTAAPPVNSLVRLAFTLPPDEAKITISAHVTAVGQLDDGKDQYPGFVARFVGLDGAVKERWERLVSWLRNEHGPSVRKTITFARPSYVRLFQQQAPAASDLWLRPASVEHLLVIIGREIPTGTIFVPTTATVTPGINVKVQLVHPITEAVLPLEGVVRRRGADPDVHGGVMVSLHPFTEEDRARLTEMADSVVVLDDYDIELYEEPSVQQKGAPPQ